MKMNIEVDLDFINEDYTVNEEIKGAIIGRVSSTIERVVLEQIKPKIDNAFNKDVEKHITAILDNYMSKPVVVSNGYKREEYDSALDMVERKFTSLYDEKMRNKNNCSKDPLFEKINDRISLEVRNVISKLDNTIVIEARKIADEKIKSSALYVALEKLGHIKEA